ncbi:hypothetical protein [Azospirillum doebereinerae]
MTAANIFVNDTGIMCVTDTLMCSTGDCAPAALSHAKCKIYHEQGFAITTRGSHILGKLVSRRAKIFSDINSAVDRLGWYIAGFPDDCFEKVGCESLEIFIMGYSADTKIAASYYIKRTGGEHSDVITETLPVGYNFYPGIPDKILSRLPIHWNEEILKKASLAQWRADREITGSLAIGGVMHLTEIREGRISQRVIGTYPDYDNLSSIYDDPCRGDVLIFRKGRENA